MTVISGVTRSIASSPLIANPALSALLVPSPTTSPSELKVHLIDVGQGDSILIDLGETEILIDGGDRSPGVVTYLNNYVDGAIEAMVATHPHADHIGGLIAVLAYFNVNSIWLNGDTSTSQTYIDFMSAANSEGAAIYIAKRGDQIKVGSLVLNVLNPPQPLFTSTNNNSIVLLLRYGDTDFLFTGDAEKEAEESMVAAHLIPDVEVLKVGHHGSNTASTSQFLQAAKPEVAIYMAGIGNNYGHPHDETIAALREIGAEIYGTDINGTIIVTTDGKSYYVQVEKTLPGDANHDGKINALDIAKVERIIALLDSATSGADANQDGKLNALDITKVERIIAGLD